MEESGGQASRTSAEVRSVGSHRLYGGGFLDGIDAESEFCLCYHINNDS